MARTTRRFKRNIAVGGKRSRRMRGGTDMFKYFPSLMMQKPSTPKPMSEIPIDYLKGEPLAKDLEEDANALLKAAERERAKKNMNLEDARALFRDHNEKKHLAINLRLALREKDEKKIAELEEAARELEKKQSSDIADDPSRQTTFTNNDKERFAQTMRLLGARGGHGPSRSKGNKRKTRRATKGKKKTRRSKSSKRNTRRR